MIRSIKSCAICELKKQGVLNPEDYVLPQYAMPDPTKPPIPLDYDIAAQSGVLLLEPDQELIEDGGLIPQTGGVVGTVKSIFRVLGFGKSPEQVQQEAEPE